MLRNSNEIVNDLSNYKVQGLMRSGRVSDTFHVINSGTDLCLKILKPSLVNDENSILQFKNEYRALRLIDHKAFLKVGEWSEESGVPYYITEYFPHVSLRESLCDLDKYEKDEVFRSIVKACAYLHSLNFIHFGLKPDNILYSKGEIKLVQLGQVRFEDESIAYPDVFITEGYTDPSVIQGSGLISKKSDVYSVSSIGTFLYTGKEGATSEDILNEGVKKLLHTGHSGLFLDCNEMLNKGTGVIDSIESTLPQKSSNVNNIKAKKTKDKLLFVLITSFLVIGIVLFVAVQHYAQSSDLENANSSSDKERLPIYSPAQPRVAPKPLEIDSSGSAEKEEFSRYISKFNSAIDSSNKIEQLIIQADPNPQNFNYSEASESDLLGDIEGASDHIDLFTKRYNWVKPLLEKYKVNIEISENFVSEWKPCAINYRRYLSDIDSKKDRSDYVKRFLEGMCISDYLFCKGSARDKEDGFKIMSSVLRDVSLRSQNVKELAHEMEIPAIMSIYWPLLADHPDLITQGSLSYAVSVLHACTIEEACRIDKWILGRQDIIEAQKKSRIIKVILYNRCVANGALKYAVFVIHSGNGKIENKSIEGAVRKVFKRIYAGSFKEEYPIYSKLYRNAYPNENK